MNKSLFFLPGLMCNDRLWHQVWPLLNDNLKPQAINFGAHHNMDAIQTDITQSLDLEPANLVGFSMGGYLAMRYAMQFPQSINKLILICATGSNLTKHEQTKRKKIIAYAKSNYYSGINDQRIKQFVHPKHAKGPVADTIKQMDQELGKEYLIAHMEATAERPALYSQLEKLDCPVLLIAAEQDTLIPPAQMELLAKHFKHATLKVIPDCGHMSPLEAPQQVASWINEYMS